MADLAADPEAAPTVGWGVLAPGRIAHAFAADLALVPEGRLVATGSRSRERAEAFAEAYGGTAYGSYAELVADDAVDVVYIASPHSLHTDHVRLCLDAGKAVLCEKPLTLTGPEAEALLAEARARGVFAMEAMWTACHPLVRHVLDLLASGEYGEVRQLRADLGFVVRTSDDDRLLDPSLGASALLDMGIYPLTLARLVLGAPEELAATATLSERGIDLAVAIAGRYPGGATAALTATMTAYSPRSASIATDRGRFEFPENFHSPTHVDWLSPGAEARRITPPEPVIGRGYGNEIVEVHRCLREGLLESPLVPHAATVETMTTMDAVRQQIGVWHQGPFTAVD